MPTIWIVRPRIILTPMGCKKARLGLFVIFILLFRRLQGRFGKTGVFLKIFAPPVCYRRRQRGESGWANHLYQSAVPPWPQKTTGKAHHVTLGERSFFIS